MRRVLLLGAIAAAALAGCGGDAPDTREIGIIAGGTRGGGEEGGYALDGGVLVLPLLLTRA